MAGFSKPAICNIALGNVAINRLIIDFDADTSSQAQLCRSFYDLALETVLLARRWKFAQYEVAPGIISSFDSERWQYAYRMPSDALRVHTVNATADNPEGEPFEVGGDSTGGVIYCDVADAVVQYTANVTNSGLYSTDFVMSLGWRLAMFIAPGMSANESLRQAASKGYDLSITEADTAAGNEGMPGVPDEGAFLKDRGQFGTVLPLPSAGFRHR